MPHKNKYKNKCKFTIVSISTKQQTSFLKALFRTSNLIHMVSSWLPGLTSMALMRNIMSKCAHQKVPLPTSADTVLTYPVENQKLFFVC